MKKDTKEEKFITEVCFGLDKEVLDKYEGKKEKNVLALAKVCAFYNDGTAEIVDFSDINDGVDKNVFLKEAKKHLVEGGVLTSSVLDGDMWNDAVMRVQTINDLEDFIPDLDANVEKNEKENEEGEQVLVLEGDDGTVTVLPSDEDIIEDVDGEMNQELDGDEQAKENVKKGIVRGGLVAGAVLAAGLGIGGALKGCGDEKQDTDDLKSYVTEVGASETTIVIPDISGKNFEFYKQNALETTQKDVFVNKMSSWLENTNGAEEWQRIALTDEEKKQYEIEGDECIFGFTPEESLALVLRFGHYEEKELLNITGGKEIDVDQTIELSNKAITNAITYYMLSTDSKLGIEKLINFDESGIKAIESFENLLAEYKAVEFEDGKEDEALEKMKTIKKALLEFANDTEVDQRAKSWILRTVLPACSAISVVHQYEDVIELNVYNNKTNSNEIVEAKTALFDEIMMRSSVLGFDETFDSEAYLEELGIDPKQYNLLMTDVEKSSADLTYAEEKDNLDNFVKYAHQKNVENYAAETLMQPKGSLDGVNNVKTEYDEVTLGAYDCDQLLEMLSNYMKENNIYPQISAFDKDALYAKKINMFFKEVTEQQIEYKDTHGITKGEPGDIVKDETTTKKVDLETFTTPDPIIYVDSKGNESTEEKVKEEARVKENEKKGFTTEEEAKKDAEETQLNVQDAYNAGFNYGYGIGEEISKYKDSSDSKIRESWNFGVSDGQNKKNNEAQAGKIVGGEVKVNSEYKNSEVTTSNNVVENVNKNVETPKVETKVETSPEVTAPEVTAPEVTTPEVTAPEVTTPEVQEVEPQTDPNAITEEEFFDIAQSFSLQDLLDMGFDIQLPDDVAAEDLTKTK